MWKVLQCSLEGIGGNSSSHLHPATAVVRTLLLGEPLVISGMSIGNKALALSKLQDLTRFRAFARPCKSKTFPLHMLPRRCSEEVLRRTYTKSRTISIGSRQTCHSTKYNGHFWSLCSEVHVGLLHGSRGLKSWYYKTQTRRISRRPNIRHSL